MGATARLFTRCGDSRVDRVRHLRAALPDVPRRGGRSPSVRRQRVATQLWLPVATSIASRACTRRAVVMRRSAYPLGLTMDSCPASAQWGLRLAATCAVERERTTWRLHARLRASGLMKLSISPDETAGSPWVLPAPGGRPGHPGHAGDPHGRTPSADGADGTPPHSSACPSAGGRPGDGAARLLVTIPSLPVCRIAASSPRRSSAAAACRWATPAPPGHQAHRSLRLPGPSMARPPLHHGLRRRWRPARRRSPWLLAPSRGGSSGSSLRSVSAHALCASRSPRGARLAWRGNGSPRSSPRRRATSASCPTSSVR